MESYITQYIEKLSNNYVVNEVFIESENTFINKIFRVKPNKIFSQKFFVAFSDCNQVDFKKLLDELMKVNKKQNNNKPIPCLLFVPSYIYPENLTYFNGIVFIHIVVFDKEKRQVIYDHSFHYFGAKNIKNAINLFESIL